MVGAPGPRLHTEPLMERRGLMAADERLTDAGRAFREESEVPAWVSPAPVHQGRRGTVQRGRAAAGGDCDDLAVRV